MFRVEIELKMAQDDRTSVIKHFSFHRSLNLGNLKKPLKTRKLGTWELMSLFVETSQICMLQKPKKPTET